MTTHLRLRISRHLALAGLRLGNKLYIRIFRDNMPTTLFVVDLSPQVG